MKFGTKCIITIAVSAGLVFLAVKTLILTGLIDPSWTARAIVMSALAVFIPTFALLIINVVNHNKRVKEALKAREDEIGEMNRFIEAAALITKTDAKGRITYVNDKFLAVSGYEEEEVLGRDHRIVNSGQHPREFWKEMYRTTVIEKRIWHGVVTNRTKAGDFYYVDSYIKAHFENEVLKGFISIRQDLTDLVKKTNEIERKNSYLEHAAKIIRHDMHSGINTYIPRGISSLERRLPAQTLEELKIEAPLKMIKEGLRHTQKVYKGVYEFTNLVKKDAVLNLTDCDLDEILADYLSATAYRDQVQIDELGRADVNEALFCTAIDNLIRNGLKYNDSDRKRVKVSRVGDSLVIEDNGRGLSREEFSALSKPYARKQGQKESGTGLGLNIAIAIIEEHGFVIDCDTIKAKGSVLGTKITITLK